MRNLIIFIIAFGMTGGCLASEANSSELQIIIEQAQSGDSGAQMLYGLAYLDGRYGLNKNPQKAANWFKASAKEGNHYAQLLLGNCYANGTGVNKNDTKAFQWWQKSATGGNVEAQYHLGKAYLYGEGTAHDDNKAIKWVTRSAKAGNADAQYLIGKMYHDGFVVAQDHDLARSWLTRAAANNHTGATNLLEAIDSVIKYATPVSQQSSGKLINKARQGNPYSQYELGLRYRDGAFDVPRDSDKALYWLSKAADNGELMAMKVLSEVYAKGTLGVSKNADKATYWHKKSGGRH